jgi:hypothetical protein
MGKYKYADYLPVVSTVYDSYNAAKEYKKKTGKQGYIGLSQPVETSLSAEAAKRLYEDMPWYQKSLNAMTGGQLFKSKVGRIEDLEAKARNSTGVGGEAALKKAANSTREIMNQQLNQNISTINQNWGAAGRYGSGAKQQAILGAQNSTNFNLANVVNQMSLQESQFQRSLDEERAWRQAQLDAGQPGLADKIGDIASLGIQLYGSNPEYFNEKLGAAGEKVGIGGGMYATTATEPVLGQQPMGPLLSEMPEAQYGPSTQEARATVTQLPSFMAPSKATAYQPSPMDLFSTPTQQSKEQQVQKFVNTPAVDIAASPRSPEMMSSYLYNVNIPFKDMSSLFMKVNDPNISLEEFIIELQKAVNTNGSTIQNTK